ncbi:MAG: peptidase M16 [Desulfuromonadales bacterium GWD2_61_12]|nr:MAG: peptidase M16 [Desulfuromonadales bacterium GWC2_61_20]OGR34823.1 MAG: peptidase M16 [Desulfuromonadales bacterium GWD2_61_12]HAD04039.1 insulinase family protein [Desulfuromonas sp.]HBT82808.1 insulinase family protein [Desulfuromonas sp.]
MATLASRSMFLWVTLLLLLAPAVGAAATLEEKVREHTLANGLRLLMVERHDAPTFAAYLAVGVGGVDETSENRGVAHLLEHMLFKGTTTIGTCDFPREKPILDAIEATATELDRLRYARIPDPARIAHLEGQLATLQAQHRELVVKDECSRIYSANGGVGFNAYTSKDLTTYLVELPANKLELWASIEADRMKNAVLREFYTERQVVMEERRRSYDNNPDGLLYENLLATAFAVHPYRNPIIGWMSDLEHLTLDETRTFLSTYYAPANTVIALVGDIDPDAAVALIERYFGSIPAGVVVPPVAAVEPPQRGEKRVHIQYEAEPKLSIAFHKPTLPERDDYVFDLIQHILSEGRTSRLYRALIEEQQLATSIAAYGAPGSRYPNLFVISAVPRHPHTVAEVEAAINAELVRLAQEPVMESELTRARNRLRVDLLRQLKENDGLAQMLTYYQTVAGDWRYLTRYDQAAATITAAEVQAVAARYLVPENRTVATLGREGKQP